MQGAGRAAKPLVVHEGDDEFIKTTTGYGDGQKPKDYLSAFKTFVNANRMVAIQTVVKPLKDRGGIQRASKRFDYQVLTVLNRFKKALFS